MHRWTDPLPDSLRARLDEPCVTGWGFAAGPAFAAQYRQHAETPRVLREVLTELFARRMSFKRAHVDLDDGTRVVFEPTRYRPPLERVPPPAPPAPPTRARE